MENIEINTDDELLEIAVPVIKSIPVMKKKVCKKTGEIKTYVYDQKKYNDAFYKKNKDKILEKITCDLCKGSYCKNGYNNHIKTKKHQNFIINK
jgi:hypothetical protein